MIKISIIIPFYKGNEYLERLFNNIHSVSEHVCNYHNVVFEVIIVNDSPDYQMVLPVNIDGLKVKIVDNKVNSGIHKSRVAGLACSSGDYVIFLDQDDELIEDGICQQVFLAKDHDIVVGNGLYQVNESYKTIYSNHKQMEYLISENKLIDIRNLIPSPGCCLIRKQSIPLYWRENCLINNGADDWYLWLLMFNQNCEIAINDQLVYQHNNSGVNLSFDYDKMKISCDEMVIRLQNNKNYCDKKVDRLKKAIDFKYLKDTKKMSVYDWYKYRKVVKNNIIYKINQILLSRG